MAILIGGAVFFALAVGWLLWMAGRTGSHGHLDSSGIDSYILIGFFVAAVICFGKGIVGLLTKRELKLENGRLEITARCGSPVTIELKDIRRDHWQYIPPAKIRGLGASLCRMFDFGLDPDLQVKANGTGEYLRPLQFNGSKVLGALAAAGVAVPRVAMITGDWKVHLIFDQKGMIGSGSEADIRIDTPGVFDSHIKWEIGGEGKELTLVNLKDKFHDGSEKMVIDANLGIKDQAFHTAIGPMNVKFQTIWVHPI